MIKINIVIGEYTDELLYYKTSEKLSRSTDKIRGFCGIVSYQQCDFLLIYLGLQAEFKSVEITKDSTNVEKLVRSYFLQILTGTC